MDIAIPTAAPLPPEVAATLDAKQRMIVTTAKLLQRQGYHATGLKQVVTESSAPRGSIYHHFPGGKEQLGVLAVRAAAAELTRAIGRARSRSDGPADLVQRLARSLARWLETSDYLEGCPVSTVTLEVAPTSEALTAACADAYQEWIDLVAAELRAHDLGDRDAEALATTAVAAIEGALLLCRAQRSTQPLRTVASEIARLVNARAG